MSDNCWLYLRFCWPESQDQLLTKLRAERTEVFFFFFLFCAPFSDYSRFKFSLNSHGRKHANTCLRRATQPRPKLPLPGVLLWRIRHFYLEALLLSSSLGRPVCSVVKWFTLNPELLKRFYCSAKLLQIKPHHSTRLLSPKGNTESYGSSCLPEDQFPPVLNEKHY